jgi:chaperonin cofactor prefoldin
MMELNKYTEKLTRNGVLAENIYERSSRSLSLSRQEMFKLSRIRRTRLKSLKTQESELSNEVKDMENSIIYKIYNKTSLKSKFTQISTRLNTLNLISNTLNPQKTLTPDKIEEINQKTSDLIK